MLLTYLLFSLVIFIQPIAQILEKKGMSQIGAVSSINLSLLVKLITSPLVVGGVALSGIGLLLWLVVLSRANVSYIYPLGAVSYIILAFLAVVLLKEHLSALQGIGVLVIVLGSVLLNLK